MNEIFNIYFSDYFKNNKIIINIFIILTILHYMLETFGLIFIFDYIININSNKNKNKYLFYIFVFAIIFTTISYIKNRLEVVITTESLKLNRNKYINSLYDYIGENFKNIKIGSTITRILTVSSQWSDTFTLFFGFILPTFIILISIICILFYINKGIGLIMLLCLISLLIIITLKSKNIIKTRIIQNEMYYKNYDKINNQMNNLLNTLINNEENKEKNKISDNFSQYKNKTQNADKETYLLKLYLIINLYIFLIFVIYFTMNRNIKNKTLLVLCLLYFSSTYLKINNSINIFLENIGKCVNNINFFKKISLKNKNKTINSLSNFYIKILNLSFQYNKKKILSNLNLNIKNKSKTAIIGRSGYGKSTLCKLILKLYKYDGLIKINNIDIQNINTTYLREKIIYVNQNTNMIDTNIIDNMKYGSSYNDKFIIQLLNKYDLNNIFNGLKDGINNSIEFGGSNLSVGMQKVIILIRGILKSYKGNIIIFDEPLAGLDNNTRIKVIKLILNETKNKTLIIITHDKEILPYMDNVINIEKINNK